MATGKHDQEKANGGRAKLLVQATPDLDFTLAAATAKTKNRGTFTTYIAVDPTANFRGLAVIPQSVALPGIVVNRDNLNYNVMGSPRMDGDDTMVSLIANYKFGGYTLSSTTAYQKENRTLVFDVYNEAADWPSLASGGVFKWDMKQTSILKVKTTSQEFKLVSPQLGFVNFLTGVYYDHDKTDFDFARPSFGTPIPFSAFRVADTKTQAVYGRATWTLVPDMLDLITGLRYNKDDISYVYNLRYNTTPASASVPFSRSNSYSENTTVGDISLRFKITPKLTVYGGYTRGYKPAIWNLDGTVTATNTFLPVNAEHIDAFELGLKGNFLDNRLSLNAALFDTVYKNFQVQTFDPNAVAATFAISNAGKAHTQGFELDARALLTQNLKLTASVAYVDAKFDQYDRANCYAGQTLATGCITTSSPSYQVMTGRALPNAPKYKGSIGLEQRIGLDSVPFDLTLNGNYVYQTRVNFDPNLNPIAIQDAYGLLNLGLKLTDHKDRYSITFFVNNALDKRYVVGITDQTARWGNKSALTGTFGRDAERYAGIRFAMNF